MNLKYALILATLSLPALAQTADHAGIALANMDTSVKPGDNFFLYGNGAWIKRTEIPADRTGLNVFSEIADRTDKQVATIIADAARANAPAGSDTRRIADLYASYTDLATVEKRGLAPLQPQLASIQAIKTRAELAHALGLTLRADTDALNNTNFRTANLFGLWVAPGFHDPDHYAPYLMQGGLTLPTRDYYLADSDRFKEIRAKYLTHAATMFKLAGLSDPDARAARVLALERSIAEAQISLADSEDIKKANNLWTAAELPAKAPGLDWPAYLAAAGLTQQKSFYIWQPTAIAAESKLVADAPLNAWQDWLTLHAIEANASFLPRAFSDERFAFFGTTLSGAPQQRPLEQRAIALVNQTLGDAVGKLYAAQYFSPEAKAQAQALVANLVAAFHARLEAVTWMAPATKAEALKKLGTLRVSVGYPDTWRSYNGLTIAPDDLFGNVNRARLFEYHYQLSRIGKTVDRGEWCMEPQTVNAVNLPLNNGLNFPAAILQAPFFDPEAPLAANYGAIGTVMGHEISHTFDSEGAAFDSEGRVRDWWTPADFDYFTKATAALAAQFDTYEPLPGLHVNGRQTLGEDIADLGGVAASYDAFHHALGGKAAPAVGGFTGDQQFFIAFSQNWGSKVRDAALRQQVLTDPHAPGQDRALTVRNFDTWYAAFDVKPGQTLYLQPDQRIRIW